MRKVTGVTHYCNQQGTGKKYIGWRSEERSREVWPRFREMGSDPIK